jgi:hypothetical protein
MDHHIKCVARVLKRLAENPRAPDKPRKVCSICIDLGDLAGAIIDEGFIDAVWQSPEEPNPFGLKGLFYKRKFDNGKKTAAIICYDKTLTGPNATPDGAAERRFIVAKEVSAVFDEDGEKTATAPEIAELVSGMISSPTGITQNSKQIRADYNGVLLAIELIIPYERRRAVIAQGPVTSAVINQLAADCQFPAQFVRIALDQSYMNYITGLRRKAKVADLLVG